LLGISNVVLTTAKNSTLHAKHNSEMTEFQQFCKPFSK